MHAFFELEGVVTQRGSIRASEHRQSGRWIAQFAGSQGAQCATLFRRLEVPSYTALVSAFGQPYRDWDQQSDGVLWYLLRLYTAGELVFLGVPAGGKPAKDAERTKNQETLHNGLPSGIAACVDQEQHAAGFDGHVHLDTPWQFEQLVVENPFRSKWRTGTIALGPLEPRPIPLEIGYTDPSRTFTHLRDHGMVARWPYGSDSMFVLALADANVDVSAMFKRDVQINLATGGGFVHGVCAAIDMVRGAAQRAHAVAHLPQEEQAERLRDIDAVCRKAAEAVQRCGVGLATYQIYNSGDTGPRDYTPNRAIVIDIQDDGTVIASGRGVVVLAKKFDPTMDIPLP
ncbi:hypothetical protein AB0C47_34185 [Micromonospora taraxaci]|uniref:hypothetical protein n=1 Tax=Micromonospora taraxaci TaxID=1316803 RepID=UPI0033FD4FA9